MKTFKTAISIIAATVFALTTMSGCTGNDAHGPPTAWDLYSTTVETYKACGNSFHIKYTRRSIVNTEPDMDHERQSNFEIEMKRNGADAMKFSVNLETGEEIESIYIGGLAGIRYYRDHIGKNTFKIKKNYLLKSQFDLKFFFPKFTEKDLENVEVVKTDDGYSYKLDIDDDVIRDVFGHSDLKLDDLDYYRVESSLTFYFGEDKIVKKVDCNIYSKSVDYIDKDSQELFNFIFNWISSWEFIDPGTVPEILPPEDADEYVPDISSEFDDDGYNV